MPQRSRIQCQDDGEADERVRSGRTPSPVAGRKRVTGARRSSVGRSRARSCGRGSGKHKGACEGEQESPKMKRDQPQNRSRSLRRSVSWKHKGSCEGEQEGPKMRRDQSAGRRDSRSTSSPVAGRQRLSVSKGRRASPVSKRIHLPTLNGTGVSKRGDRSTRRKNKQISRRASTAGNLETTQFNAFHGLERGLHSNKPALVLSDVSESSDLGSEKIGTATKSPLGANNPGLNMPSEERREAIKRSSDPVKLELDGSGVEHQDTVGRRFSWWKLPSSRDLGDLEEDEDDLPPAVVPPSRRMSLTLSSSSVGPSITEEDQAPTKPSGSKKVTPKQSKRASKRSKKKTRRTKSTDSMDSVFTLTTDGESGSFLTDDSSDALFSPSVQKPILTCNAETSNNSLDSSGHKRKKERLSRKSKRKSVKEGSKRRSDTKEQTRAEQEGSDTSMRELPAKVSLGDHCNRSLSKSLQRSMNPSLDVSAHSHRSNNNKRGTISMAVKLQNSIDLSRSSMVSLSLSNDQDGCSIGSFGGSADFDFEEEDTHNEDPSVRSNNDIFREGENSFHVLDDEGKRALRRGISGKTRESSRRDRKSPRGEASEQGLFL